MTADDSYLKEVFPEPPLTTFRKQNNVKDHVIRAKVPKTQPIYPKIYMKGIQKCGGNCPACPFITEGKNIDINGTQWIIERSLNCYSYNVVYAIFCKKNRCQQVYRGETKRILKYRLADHHGYVTNNVTTQATRAYFTQPGHIIFISICVQQCGVYV